MIFQLKKEEIRCEKSSYSDRSWLQICWKRFLCKLLKDCSRSARGYFEISESWQLEAEAKNVELGVLLEGLRFCVQCKLGPIPLTLFNIVGESRKWISSYLYVWCKKTSAMLSTEFLMGRTIGWWELACHVLLQTPNLELVCLTFYNYTLITYIFVFFPIEPSFSNWITYFFNIWMFCFICFFFKYIIFIDNCSRFLSIEYICADSFKIWIKF